MEELFAEYIVKCKLSSKMLMARVGLIIGAVLLSVLSFPLLRAASFIAIAIIIYVVVYLWGLTNVEYEYSIVNTDLIIEAIYGQKSRKRKLELDLKKVDNIALISTGELSHYQGRAVVKDFSSLTDSTDLVGIIYHEKDSTVEAIIEPNERVLNAIKMARPNFSRYLSK